MSRMENRPISTQWVVLAKISPLRRQPYWMALTKFFSSAESAKQWVRRRERDFGDATGWRVQDTTGQARYESAVYTGPAPRNRWAFSNPPNESET